MNILNLKTVTKCCGCGACLNSCPKGAISLNLQNGFFVASVNKQLCVECGACVKNCYRDLNFGYLKFPETIYTLKNKNKKILKKSSSGGVSYELMQKAIELGYFVYAFSYDKKTKECILKKAKTCEECSMFFGSKYFQSNLSDPKIFEEILSNNRNQKLAFFGTPCFIASMRRFLERNGFRDFLLVDLFCHGIPSGILWKKYAEKMEKKLGNYYDVEFRSKKFGWHYFTNAFDNGKHCYSSINDKFYELFFSGLFFNEPCYNCEVRGSFAYSDIRLGDAWGATYDMDSEGVSLVVANSDKGCDLIKDILDKFDVLPSIEMKEIKKFQSAFENRTNLKSMNTRIDYEKMSFDEIYNFYFSNLSTKKKHKIFLHRVFNKLPFLVKQSTKRKLHKKEMSK